MKKFLITLLVFTLISCSKHHRSSHQISVGTMAGPETQIMQTAAAVAQQRYGLKVNIITFSNYIIPNQALEDGDIDANAFQHLPYLISQNKERGFHLVSVGKTILYPMSLYSNTIKNLDALPQNAKVAIPNDPSNQARALLLLQQHHLITLKKGTGIQATTDDVIKNVKNIDFIALNAAQLPRSLNDVSLAAINTNYATAAQLNPNTIVATESNQSPYVNIIATTPALAHTKKIQELVAAYHSRPVAMSVKRLFGNKAILGWAYRPLSP